MNNEISVPEEYTIYQQDLSQTHLQLKIMGTVKTIEEARNMCKVFNEVDKEVLQGKHTYIFTCTKVKGENNGN